MNGTRWTLIAGAVAVIGALSAVYGTNLLRGNAETGDCADAAAIVERLKPFAKGEVAAMTVSARPQVLPNVSFNAPDGSPLKLADFKGRTILLNLWATWCAPCKLEMPALDKLQGELGGKDFEVVAVNIDTRNLDKPKQWLKETGVAKLAAYADPSSKLFFDLKAAGKAEGMPTTILIDREGCELGTVAGPADWGSPDAFALIKAALGRG